MTFELSFIRGGIFLLQYKFHQCAVFSHNDCFSGAFFTLVYNFITTLSTLSHILKEV